MRYLALISKVIAFLLLLSFAVKNSDSVTLRYIMGWEWHSPLSLLLLIAFAVGLAFGMLGSTRRMYRLKREVARLNQSLDQIGREPEKRLEAGTPG